VANQNSDYHISQRKKLLKNFDNIAKRAQKKLFKSYDEDFAKLAISETRVPEQLKGIIPSREL